MKGMRTGFNIERLQQSIVWRFLPLLMIAVVVIAISLAKTDRQGPASVYDEADGHLLCNRFCDGLMFCQAEALRGQDDATKRAIRSACYTGCRKHEDRLFACESELRKAEIGSTAQCGRLTSCFK